MSRRALDAARDRKDWQCVAWQILMGDKDVEVEPHVCTLVKLHYGPHKCWCGWTFSDEVASWHQMSFVGA